MIPPLLPLRAIALTLLPSPRDRVSSALATKVAKHPHLTIAFERAMEALTSPADHPFVLAVGPGGVGKGLLIRLLNNALHYEVRLEMAADPTLKPAIVVDAPASATAQFDFAELYRRIAEAADGPLDGTTGDSVMALGVRAAVNGALGDARRDAFRAAVRACRNRGVRTILLDESNHLSVVAGSSRAPEQLDKFKDFAKVAGVRILFVGAFPVLAFRDISFQMARRIRTVPFLGYEALNKREVAGFRSAATRFLEAMEGVEIVPDDELIGYLLAGSAGCVGNLRNWLVDAENHMRRNPNAGDLRAVLGFTAYGKAALGLARAEIEAGKLMLAGKRAAIPERAYVAPLNASGQVRKPGEAIPTRLQMPEESVA